MKVFMLVLLILVTLGGAACCICLNKADRSPVNEVKDADPKAAEVILENLAGALRMHSAQNGGGGNGKFANDLSQLSGLYANKIQSALPGTKQSSFYGYIVRLEENPVGDNFATNFRLVAYPANGYKGDIFAIDKKEKIEKFNK